MTLDEAGAEIWEQLEASGDDEQFAGAPASLVCDVLDEIAADLGSDQSDPLFRKREAEVGGYWLAASRRDRELVTVGVTGAVPDWKTGGEHEDQA